MEETISNADNYMDSLPIVLPAELYNKLKNTGNRMYAVYNVYVNEGKKPIQSALDSFELFELAKTQFSLLSKDADGFITENQGNPLICKKSEVDWLLLHHKKSTVQRIAENGGKYNEYTLGAVSSYDFVKSYIKLFIEL